MSWMVKQASPDERRARRARLWRRRVLLKKGARLHAQMLANADDGALAMLDEDGVVVSWYSDGPDDTSPERLLDHHVSQFYLSNDVTLGVPMRDLSTAAIHGVSKQLGWRRAADGSVCWAMTQIESELLGDGRLQGFAHVIRRTPIRAEARSALQSPFETIDAANTPSPSKGIDYIATGLGVSRSPCSFSACA